LEVETKYLNIVYMNFTPQRPNYVTANPSGTNCRNC